MFGSVLTSFAITWGKFRCEASNSTKWSAFLSHNAGVGASSFDGIACNFGCNRKHKFSMSSAPQNHNRQVMDSPLVDEGVEEAQVFSYLFHTESDGLVKVLVRSKSKKYIVHFKVSVMQYMAPSLVLNWGMFRSNQFDLIELDPVDPVTDEENLGRRGDSGFFSKSLSQNPNGEYTTKLEFDSSHAPAFISFTLSTSPISTVMGSEIRTHRKEKFCVPFGTARGSPVPLGLSYLGDGMVNFALFARNAESVNLCLYSHMEGKASLEILLDPYLNRTGDTWHISMLNVQDYLSYGYRCNGSAGHRFDMHNVLLDPYAKLLSLTSIDAASPTKLLGSLRLEPTFNWSGDDRPRIPMEKLVVYRLNIRKFTEDASSQLSKKLAGSFSGVIEKIDHLKSLGINAILLEPIFTFNEANGPYFPSHFFSPMDKYGPENDVVSSIASMKNMVKELHASGIEVLLEIAFTHAAEGGDSGHQIVTFSGIDSSSYYEVGIGTVHAFRCSSPVVQSLILDSLRHWVVEYHIDGFCFLNASSFIQDFNRPHSPRPALLEAIAFDPLLSKIKLIADCWSPLDMSYKEVQLPHWKRWAEMNQRFCTDVRNFLRGKGLLTDLATRLCGSGDIFFASRGPSFSFNFIAKNFGLPLVDLVSFNNTSSELGWNCGEEGLTSSSNILDLRLRQIRNFIFVLFISLGVPVLNMGDECGHSTGGSPSYSKRKPFNWNALKTVFSVQIMEFIAFLCSLRDRRSDIFQVRNFLSAENIQWYGSDQSPPNWDDQSCRFLAMLLKASDQGNVFVAINADDLSVIATLPQLPEGCFWSPLVDTALPYPGFFDKNGNLSNKLRSISSGYEIQPHSCALFESKAWSG